MKDWFDTLMEILMFIGLFVVAIVVGLKVLSPIIGWLLIKAMER